MGALAALKPRPVDEPVVWLSPAQVCERIPGMTERHLGYLRGKRQGPAYSKPTLKTVVYSAADVDAWVAASRVATKAVS